MLQAWSIALIVFLTALAGAFIGCWLGRTVAPHHLTSETREVIKAISAMMATLSALVLGLLIASAKSSYDEKDAAVTLTASQVIGLDHILSSYGPEARPARKLLQQLVIERIRRIWPDGSQGRVDASAVGHGTGIEVVQKSILALAPASEAQRWLQTAALRVTSDLANQRWLTMQRSGRGILTPLLIVLTSWMALILGSLGLYAPRNASAYIALVLGALAFSTAVYLIVELDQPYRGFIRISDAPLIAASRQIAHD